jgi:LTXXQ motif family protein
MAAQLDAVRAMDKLLKPLYAALSDSQKQTADQLFWGPMGMM